MNCIQTIFYFLFFLFSTFPCLSEAKLPQIYIQASQNLSETGYFTLNWEIKNKPQEENKSALFELQSSQSQDFSNATILYQGTQKHRFISGLLDGNYFYRIKATFPQNDHEHFILSEIQKIEVKHHSLDFALYLLMIGAIIFSLIVFMIWHGNRNQKAI